MCYFLLLHETNERKMMLQSIKRYILKILLESPCIELEELLEEEEKRQSKTILFEVNFVLYGPEMLLAINPENPARKSRKSRPKIPVKWSKPDKW